MIDIKLRTFVTVVETRSYTKTADLLHLTQPAITQHMKQLEHYYKQVLILHPHKEFALSKAGKQLYEYAKIQIHNETLFEAQLRAEDQTLLLGSTLSIADYYLSDVLSQYLLTTKQKCEVIVENTTTLLQSMIDGNVDCAFVEGRFNTDLFDYQLFQMETFLPVVRSQHPLANQKLAFSDILYFPLFLREKGSGTRAIFEIQSMQTLYSLDAFHKIIEIGSMNMIKQMILQTDGISFLYQRVVKDELSEGTIVPLQLQGFPILHPMYFIYLKSNLKKDTYLRMFQEIMKMKPFDENQNTRV